MKHFYVYIMAKKPKGALYVGVTSDLVKRVWEHKNHSVAGFTSRYKIENLVYYEIFEDGEAAIEREKRIKKWDRQWKYRLIRQTNPEWRDLYMTLCHLSAEPDSRPRVFCKAGMTV